MTFVRKSRILLLILVVIVVYAGFGETFGKLWQAHILQAFTLPALADFEDILWFGIVGVVSIPMSLLATEIVRKRSDLEDSQVVVRMLLMLFVALSASTLLFALSQTFVLTLVGIWLADIVVAMIQPLMDIWLNRHIESQIRATVLSIVGQVNAFGEIAIGGLAGGAIATTFGVRMAIVVVALALLPLGPIFLLMGKGEAVGQGLSKQAL